MRECQQWMGNVSLARYIYWESSIKRSTVHYPSANLTSTKCTTISNRCNHLISWHWQIGCYDWDEHDTNDLIGCVDLTLRQLIDAKESGVSTYILIFFSSYFLFDCGRLIALIMMMMAVMTLLGQTVLLLHSC